MNTLFRLLSDMEAKIPALNKKVAAVSLSPVGWHIDHSLLLINTIVNAVKTSDSKQYKWKFNAIRTLIYAVGTLPRGKVQAPEVVRPKNAGTIANLPAAFASTKANIETLDALPPNCFFKHPYFGDLNVKPTKTFLKIHTAHHLKIINDIIKKA